MLICTFRGISREEELQKSIRKEKILTLCLLRFLLGLPFCRIGIGIDRDRDFDVSGNGEESSQNIRIKDGELVVKRSPMPIYVSIRGMIYTSLTRSNFLRQLSVGGTLVRFQQENEERALFFSLFCICSKRT